MPLSPELENLVYPEAAPYNDGYLKVSDLHTIYWQAYGNRNGIPVICLHGGPGSGLSEWHARLFDLSKYHVILFDQRGCGRSTPFAELRENTTAHLTADMDALRLHLNITDWNIFGGSWGSTLALAYADQYPRHVRGLVIYGIFLARQKEYHSMFAADGPAALLYPEYYEAFLSVLPAAERTNPISAYQALFDHEDDAIRSNALRAWSHWEMRLLTLIPDEDMFAPENEDMSFLTTHSRFEQHYFKHNGFIDGDALLHRIGAKLTDKSVFIIQGRYDLVCPPITAYELHRAIPHSTLKITPSSGHSGKNIETIKELMNAVHKLT